MLYIASNFSKSFFLTGQIPEWLENLKELTSLDLGSNKFEGACRIPCFIASKSYKSFFFLQERSHFHWVIVSIWHCSILEGTNSQVIVSSIILHCLEKLQVFFLTGEIPLSLGKCVNLIVLELRRNKLTGKCTIHHTRVTSSVVIFFLLSLLPRPCRSEGVPCETAAILQHLGVVKSRGVPCETNVKIQCTCITKLHHNPNQHTTWWAHYPHYYP